jgi:lactobin A/cerein 7B family class IIb bacteriocin
MNSKLNRNFSGIKELSKDEMCKIEGGLGVLAVILAVGGICGGAIAYKKFCDSANEIGQKIGAGLAR